MLSIWKKTMFFQVFDQGLSHYPFKHLHEVAGQGHWSVVLRRSSASPLVDRADKHKKEVRSDNSLLE
jgi:hypothetical protein